MRLTLGDHRRHPHPVEVGGQHAQPQHQPEPRQGRPDPQRQGQGGGQGHGGRQRPVGRRHSQRRAHRIGVKICGQDAGIPGEQHDARVEAGEQHGEAGQHGRRGRQGGAPPDGPRQGRTGRQPQHRSEELEVAAPQPAALAFDPGQLDGEDRDHRQGGEQRQRQQQPDQVRPGGREPPAVRPPAPHEIRPADRQRRAGQHRRRRNHGGQLQQAQRPGTGRWPHAQRCGIGLAHEEDQRMDHRLVGGELDQVARAQEGRAEQHRPQRQPPPVAAQREAQNRHHRQGGDRRDPVRLHQDQGCGQPAGQHRMQRRPRGGPACGHQAQRRQHADIEPFGQVAEREAVVGEAQGQQQQGRALHRAHAPPDRHPQRHQPAQIGHGVRQPVGQDIGRADPVERADHAQVDPVVGRRHPRIAGHQLVGIERADQVGRLIAGEQRQRQGQARGVEGQQAQGDERAHRHRHPAQAADILFQLTQLHGPRAYRPRATRASSPACEYP